MAWMVVLPLCITVVTHAAPTAEPVGRDTSGTALPARHDPYDLTQAAPVDSSDYYTSPRPNVILALPKYALEALKQPLGSFTIYAERVKLVTRYYRFFTNEAGTFGVLPQVNLGGETGSGGGLRVFHTDLWGGGGQLEGSAIYAGPRGHSAEALYHHAGLLGSRLDLSLEGSYLNTRNHSATVNAQVRESPTTQFEISRLDTRAIVQWRRNRGLLAPCLRNTSVSAWAGYGLRDLSQVEGPPGLPPHPGLTPEAALMNGLGETVGLYRFGVRLALDNRDYRDPVRSLLLPLNYQLPGRVAIRVGDRYYFWRDLSYPERGGLLAVEAEYATGSDNDVRFYRAAAELSRYITLFWKDRVLALYGRLERVRRIDDGLIPYPDLAVLGGSRLGRGFRRGYFRGQGSLLLSVEYRYPIWDTWNAYLFWDESQVFDHLEDIAPEGFRTAWGAGAAFRTELGLIGRVQAAHSGAERLLLGFTLEQAF